MSAEKSDSVRIIGGQWRGRILRFPNVADLRPTHNRIRETVFNWLMPHIVGAHCLDLFSGSGAFGFEALSRGAAHSTFVEHDPQAVKALQSNARLLKTTQCDIIQKDFSQIDFPKNHFDIVFLDPPYRQGLLQTAISKIMPALKKEAVIYFEVEKELLINLPENLTFFRHKSTAAVQYGLMILKT